MAHPATTGRPRSAARGEALGGEAPSAGRPQTAIRAVTAAMAGGIIAARQPSSESTPITGMQTTHEAG